MIQLHPCERFFSFDESIKLKLNIFTEKEKKHKQLTIEDYIYFIYFLGFDIDQFTTKIAVKRIKLTDSVNCTIDEINWLRFSRYDSMNETTHKPEWFLSDKKYYSKDLKIETIVKQHLNCQFSKRKHRKIKGRSPETNIFYKIEKTYGLSRSPNADVIAFDIDSHPKNKAQLQECKEKAQQILISLIKKLDKTPCYIERSKNGGFHVFFKLDTTITKDVHKNIKQWIKQSNIKVEINSQNSVFQLPNSIYYEPGKIILDNDTIKFIPLNMKEAAYTFLEVIKDKTNIISKDFFIINNEIKEKKPIKTKQTFFDLENNNKKIYENIYISNNKNVQINTNSLYFGWHERCKVWFNEGKIFTFYRLANGNFNEFKKLIQQYDTGSEDLQKNNANSIIFNAFHWAKQNIKEISNNIHHTCTSPKFISNIKYVEKYHPELKKILKQFSQQFCKLYLSSTYTKEKRFKTTIKIVEHIFLEIFGRIIFEEKTNFQRKISNNIPLTKEKKEELEQGTIFYFNQLSLYLKTLYPHINIRNIIRICIKNTSFFNEFSQIHFNTFSIQKRYKLKEFLSLDNIVSFIKLNLKKIIKKYLHHHYFIITLIYVKVFYGGNEENKKKDIMKYKLLENFG